MKTIMLFKKFKHRLSAHSKQKQKDVEYWNAILNPYTTKPRFRRLLDNDREKLKGYLSRVYNPR